MPKANKNKDAVFVSLPGKPSDEELDKISKETGRSPEELRRTVDLCEIIGDTFDEHNIHPSEALNVLVSLTAITISHAPKTLQPKLIQGVFSTLWESAGLPQA